MRSPAIEVEELATGQCMTVAEFMRRWEDLPDLKNAELINGVVYVSSPLSLDHGRRDRRIINWLTMYQDSTPGCECANNITWYMLASAPQPDAYLRILPSRGGQSRDEGAYCAGAPELAVEICVTSTDLDFGGKLDLYRRAEVREYITIETLRRRILWRFLENGVYVVQETPEDGILRSRVFPGLWLDVGAFWDDDGPKFSATLNAGFATKEHRRFVESLAQTR